MWTICGYGWSVASGDFDRERERDRDRDCLGDRQLRAVPLPSPPASPPTTSTISVGESKRGVTLLSTFGIIGELRPLLCPDPVRLGTSFGESDPRR
jgi:hypothetical protein|tara:strand:+ start:1126 stop:1413 length:288 start_codon:yes stop_codon:yes gene_type:complete